MKKIKLLFPLTEISAGSIVFVSQKNIVSDLIRFYEKIDEIGYLLRKDQYLPHHVQVYFGGGNNYCFSAEARGFIKVPIQQRFTKDSVVVVAQYMPLTVDNLDGMKDYCYGAKGKLYNFGAILNFGIRFFSWVPVIRNICRGKLTSWAWAVMCSQSVVEMFSCADIRVSDKDSENTTPAHILRFISQGRYLNESDITIGKWRLRILWK